MENNKDVDLYQRVATLEAYEEKAKEERGVIIEKLDTLLEKNTAREVKDAKFEGRWGVIVMILVAVGSALKMLWPWLAKKFGLLAP
jgi:hypothetical protein